MIQLKQMGEAKAARTKNRILYYGGLLVQVSMGRDDLTQCTPPEKAPRTLALCLKGDTIHLPKRQGSLRSYFRKDRRCRAVNSVFPQTTRGRQHTSGCCRVLLRNTWSSAQDKTFRRLPTCGRQSEWTNCLGPGHYSPPTVSCNYKP